MIPLIFAQFKFLLQSIFCDFSYKTLTVFGIGIAGLIWLVVSEFVQGIGEDETLEGSIVLLS